MSLMGSLTGGIQVLSGLSGLLGGNSAAKRARQAQLRAIANLRMQMSQDEQDLRAGNQRVLAGLAGRLGSALEAQGSSLGAGMAGAGVYNSSATAGALSLNARDNAGILREAALQGVMGEQALARGNRDRLFDVEMGSLKDEERAGQQLYGSGLQSLLGGLERFAPGPKKGKASKFKVGAGTISGLNLTGAGSGLPSVLGSINQANQKRLGVPNARNMGNAKNGKQNGAMLEYLLKGGRLW